MRKPKKSRDVLPRGLSKRAAGYTVRVVYCGRKLVEMNGLGFKEAVEELKDARLTIYELEKQEIENCLTRGAA